MNELKSQLESLKGKIVWIASYPKSGNTWFRCFWSALVEKELKLTKLYNDGIFSDRGNFDRAFDIDSKLLTEREVKNRMPQVIRYYAKQSNKLLFCKIHDAYSINSQGNPIIPADVSQVALYIIRNPLDVVASYANHVNSSIDKAIQDMNKENGYLAHQKDGLNLKNQFPQLIYNWSGHVKSWHNQNQIPIVTIRYEDMKQNGMETFKRAILALGINVDDASIQEAMTMSQFERIQSLEKKEGFREKNINSPSFFRKGQVGGHEVELTSSQKEQIIKFHGETMKKYDYL